MYSCIVLARRCRRCTPINHVPYTENQGGVVRACLCNHGVLGVCLQHPTLTACAGALVWFGLRC